MKTHRLAFIASLTGTLLLVAAAVSAQTIWLDRVKSSAAPGHNFLTGLDTSGNLTTAQPVAGDIGAGALAANVTINNSNWLGAALANANLANSSITIAGHTVALGGTQAIAYSDLSSGAPTATSSVRGLVSPDGTTLSNTSGAISLNLGHANSWAATQTFAPAAGSLASAFSISQSPAGTPLANFNANPMNIVFGALSNAGYWNYGAGPTCSVTSTLYSGQLACSASELTVSALGNVGYPNDQFIANFNLAIATANTSDLDASIFGGNDNVAVSGTGWSYIVGREIDITASVPVLNKNALRITQSANDTNRGSSSDAAIEFINQTGAVGWINTIYIDNSATPQNILKSQNLTISGTGLITTSAAGTASVPAIELTSCGNCGIYAPGTNKMDFSVGAGKVLDYNDTNAGYWNFGSSIAMENNTIIQVGGINLYAASFPTSGGAVKGTLCADTSGNVYIKTSTGACL